MLCDNRLSVDNVFIAISPGQYIYWVIILLLCNQRLQRLSDVMHCMVETNFYRISVNSAELLGVV